MLRLSRRLLLPAVAVLFAFAAPAQAAPPTVTLSAPSGHSAANPPSFAGTGSRKAGDSSELVVEIYKGGLDGEIAGDGSPIQTTSAIVHEDGSFGGTFNETLPDGTYTARARQFSRESGTGSSNQLVFTIGEVVVTPTPTPTPTPEPTATPIPQAAAATPTATATPVPVATTKPAYVCKSRRNFTKHVRRPDGTRLKVVATVEGRVLTSIRRGHDILVRVDLRGLLKDTYNLRVAITRTRPDGQRVTTESVTQVRYRTCVPRGRG